jgi:hypothetical protein
MSRILEYISKFTRPSDSITDRQVDILIEAAGTTFPPDIKEKLKFHIKKNWPTRSGKKSAFDLFKEVRHPCTQEYFYKLMHGTPTDEGDMTATFPEMLKEKIDRLNELDPVKEKSFYNDAKNGIEIQFSELSKFFTEGYSLHLKDNLIFKNGKPIAVRAEGDERIRMKQCHETLTETDFEQNKQQVVSADFESPGVLGEAYAKYGNPPEPTGQGRTRRRRRKGNKTKARKVKGKRRR